VQKHFPSVGCCIQYSIVNSKENSHPPFFNGGCCEVLGHKAAINEGHKVAERATKSQEVDLSLLNGFHLHFAPKNEEWRN